MRVIYHILDWMGLQ